MKNVSLPERHTFSKNSSSFVNLCLNSKRVSYFVGPSTLFPWIQFGECLLLFTMAFGMRAKVFISWRMNPSYFSKNPLYFDSCWDSDDNSLFITHSFAFHSLSKSWCEWIIATKFVRKKGERQKCDFYHPTAFFCAASIMSNACEMNHFTISLASYIWNLFSTLYVYANNNVQEYDASANIVWGESMRRKWTLKIILRTFILQP